MIRGALFRIIGNRIIAPLLFCGAIVLNVPVSNTQAATDDMRFGHHITLHPVVAMPSVISFVPGETENIAGVRALLLLDGELLTVPLISESGTKSFRGTFPTPRQSLSCRFQVIRKDGRAQISSSFEVKPECPGSDALTDNSLVRKALVAQQMRERLRVSRDLLRGFIKRLPE